MKDLKTSIDWFRRRKQWAGICGVGILMAWPGGALFGQRSPELLPDGRVTFRLKAPEATEVMVKGQFGADLLMTKSESGDWSGTTPEPVPAGVHEYRFEAGKLRLLDPRNSAVKPQRWPGTSILHIPSEPPSLWDLRSVPHGTLHHHGYRSKALKGAWRDLVVYSPPNAKGPLPVLYLAHGFSDEEKTWTVHGKAHWILDALIAERKAVPMLVVMPDAHAIDPEGSEWNQYAPANTAAFCRELIEDVIPLIEDHYEVRRDREGRAFAGLSMGGHHALAVAFENSQHFAQVGAFSAATPGDEVVSKAMEDVEELNRRLRLLWIACGDRDFLFERNEALHATLKEAGLTHEYVVTEGENHSWPVWRRYLSRFVPKLFQ